MVKARRHTSRRGKKRTLQSLRALPIIGVGACCASKGLYTVCSGTNEARRSVLDSGNLRTSKRIPADKFATPRRTRQTYEPDVLPDFYPSIPSKLRFARFDSARRASTNPRGMEPPASMWKKCNIVQKILSGETSLPHLFFANI